MKRFVPAALAASVAILVTAQATFAGPQAVGTVFAAHIQTPPAKASTICTTSRPTDPANPAGQIACDQFVTSGAISTDYIVYLIVAQDTTGILGASFGLEYNGNATLGIDVNDWVLCADGLEFRSTGPRGEYPNAGGGNRVTWLTCQDDTVGTRAIHAVMGALSVYAYSPDRLKLTRNRPLLSGPELLVSICPSGAEVPVDTTSAAILQFGGGDDCNPCVETSCGTPVAPSTWGKIKSLYRK